jgi:methionine-rich copper-binding protein CopC
MTATAVGLLRPLVRTAAVLCVAFVATVALGSVAQAHSQLISMTPADGSLVTTAPTTVVLTFDQNVQDVGDGVVVRDPAGNQIELGKPVILNNTVTEQLAPITVPGHYTVDFRITSADGHPVTKQLGFDYLVRGTPAPSAVAGGEADGGAGGSSVAIIAVVLVGVIVFALVAWRLLRRRPA